MENSKDIFFDINLINDIIDGLADEKTEGDFYEHIKECSKCRRMYEEAQKIRAIMKEDGFLSETEFLPSADFTAKTMAKIRAAKKPTIIRIINHPAVKTITAAAACLVIALFVFRSDLFGRIEGANELANDMLTDKQDVEETASYDEEFDEAAPENGFALYAKSPDITNEETEDSVAYSAAAGGGSAGTTTTSGLKEKSYDDSEVIEEVAIEEETVECEIEESVECEVEAEEEIIEIEEEIAYEEALPEPEEEILIEEPTVEEPLPEDEEEIIAEEPTVEKAPAYATPTTDEGVDEFFSDAANSYMYFDIPDSDTEEKVRQIAYSSIARSDLDRGKYEKIILVTAIDEDVNWDGIEDNYPNRFLCIDWLTDGEYNYEVFECTVNEKEDIVLDLFGGTASEILPDIVSGDFSNEITYLILVKTK